MFPSGGADQALGNAEKWRRLLHIVEGRERQGLDDLFMAAGVAAEPDALIKTRDVGESHALRSIVGVT